MKRAILAVMSLLATPAWAQVIFQDDFEHPSGASLLWTSVRGQWAVEDGVGGRGFGAAIPNNLPPTLASLPFVLGDAEIELDIRACEDGGVWLRADATGQNGVILVLARGQVYWHNYVNGNYVGLFGLASGVWTVGQTVHVRARAVGTTFEAYINGSATPTSTHSADLPPGRVGLYDFRGPAHRFDDVIVRGVIPECAPLVSNHPASVIACTSSSTTLRARAAGNGPIDSRWEIETPGGWVDLNDGPYISQGQHRFTISGSGASDLGVQPNPAFVGPMTANVRCRFTNGCSTTFTDSATITVCPVDLNCDGGVDFNDYLEFLNLYNLEDPLVDFNADGAVDFNDYLEFLNMYNGGC